MAKKKSKDSKITTLHVIMILIGILVGFYLPQVIGGFSLSPLLKTEETNLPEISTSGFEITEVELQGNRVSYTSNCKQIFFEVHEMQALRIDKYEDQIYYSTIFATQKGKLVSFDARPSDATALAFKLEKPMYFNSTILKEQ